MNISRYRFFNNVTGWLTFIISAFVYISTIEPTASFWDCGEFITTCFKLEVGHPPGAPFFMLIGRFFTLFAFGDVTKVPVMINIMSALSSALTILFLFWSITHIARKLVLKNEQRDFTLGEVIGIIGSGLIGSLAYTFSDTFWFSAVEGEVYAMSSLFTAVVFWAILKWENVADEPHANRWIIFIAFLMGISIGVHLLNLLAIPAICFVYYFKKYTPTLKGAILVFILSAVILAVVMYGMIQGLIILASKFELLFVNGFGMPYSSGAIIYLLLLFGGIIFGLYYTLKRRKVLINTILLGVLVILIGYSTFAIIVIRSIAETPMNQNKPQDMLSLLGYLNREQYGDRPLVMGQYFNAPVERDYEEGSSYSKINGKYEVTSKKIQRIYDPAYTTVFPRMHSEQDPSHAKGYQMWAGLSDMKKAPSFAQNLRFFFRYQVGYMYLRYFMWNFAGRQNDIQGHGSVRDGNWISGIPAIDNYRLGNQELLPEYLKNNKARNKYYFLPLLLGLIGAYFLYKKANSDFWIVMLLFFFTGLAIVIYLNQTPYQPRERDYAYAGSFYAFCIYIGIGVIAVQELIKKYLNPTTAGAISTVAALLVPGLMAAENWDDHNRSDRYVARDFAKNYLNSCEKNAIIFTNGDNDTFPLWYAQEVEGIRTDVRVINLSYLRTDWYIDQMKRRAYESAPVPFSMTIDQYRQGKRDIVLVYNRISKPIDLKEMINFVASDDPKTKIEQGTDLYSYFPSKAYYLTIDTTQILNKGVIPQKYSKLIADTLKGSLLNNYVIKSELMVLDLLASNNWERPVYFAITVGPDSYCNLQDYFQLDGLAYRLVPIKTKSEMGETGRIDTDILYDKLMNQFVWGGINNPNVYLDENIQRMLMNMKNNFARLAKALINEGKKEKALAVVEKCKELMPDSLIPYNYYNLLLAETYYLADLPEKGNEILKIVAEHTMQELEFFNSLNRKQSVWVQEDKQREVYILVEISKMIEEYKQEDLAKELESKMNDIFSKSMNMNL